MSWFFQLLHVMFGLWLLLAATAAFINNRKRLCSVLCAVGLLNAAVALYWIPHGN